MPFIVMPVRPLAIAWPYWLAYGVALVALAGLIGWLFSGGVLAVLALAILVALGWALRGQRYLLHLLWVAVPAWISVSRRPFHPDRDLHPGA